MIKRIVFFLFLILCLNFNQLCFATNNDDNEIVLKDKAFKIIENGSF